MLSKKPVTLGTTAMTLGALLFGALLCTGAAGAGNDASAGETVSQIDKVPPEGCALLDDPEKRRLMDGLLLYLLPACGRAHELGQVRQSPAEEVPTGTEAGGVDVPVNDPSSDNPTSSHTQSETSLSLNEVTGTVCSGYNDSYHGTTGQGFTGYSRSIDDGATFTDQGALGAGSGGDPSIVWRRADGHFYFAALKSGDLGLWKSTDDCQSFQAFGNVHDGSFDDKELMAVDNYEASPFYGRLYVAWTDFGAGADIFSTYSADGGTSWSTPVRLSSPGASVQGAWPVVAPNGDVYVGWVQFPGGNMDIRIARSTDGGVSFSEVTPPAAGKPEPRDAAASGNCGRSALKGNIRYLPSPQLAVGPDGVLHAVYSYDPDGAGTGDVVDVFYRRSTDSGATWEAELRLNDDATSSDQFYPTISLGESNVVSAAWYDRRLDPSNLLIDYYHRFSFDGGATWAASERVSDVSTPVYLDPQLATCYHGDYDTQIQTPTHALPQWADDRNIQGGHNDPDVYLDRMPVSTDFLVIPAPSLVAVCTPDDATYDIGVPQFLGFSEDVTLSTDNLPTGLADDFVPNPVTPPGSSVLTLSGTGAVTAGSYLIDVIGTSSPSNIVHEAEIGLTVYTAQPGVSILTAPANGATDQSTRPTFEWTAASQAASYRLEVDDDPAFASPELVETGIEDTSITAGTDLMSNTLYYWRVRAENICGEGMWSATFSFTTAPLPGDCVAGTLPVISFEDDFEAGATGWTHSGTGDTWALSGARVHGGAWSYHAADVGTVTDQRLVSPPITLPVDQSPLTLQFWTWQEMESKTQFTCWDGGIIEISEDGGGSWQQLFDVRLLTDPYDGPIDTSASNPLSGLRAWCGDPQDWLKSVVDVEDKAGMTVQFRFRLGTDVAVSREGWYVDDVAIQGCELGPEVFADGFESGDTSRWSATVE